MVLIKTQRDTLLAPLQSVSGIVERRHTLPILSNVLLEKKGDRLTLLATDIEIQITTTTQGAGGDGDGAVTVGARKLQEILRSLPDTTEVSLLLEDKRLQVRGGKSRFSLQTLPADDFPRMTISEGETKQFSISQKAFRQLLAKTQYAMAAQDVRYYLNGLLLLVEGTELRAVATDGHRLAFASVAIETELPRQEMILPRKTVLELNRLLVDTDDALNITLTSNQVRFAFGSVVLVSKLIDGKFPDYERVVPATLKNHMKVGRQTLMQAMQRARHPDQREIPRRARGARRQQPEADCRQCRTGRSAGRNRSRLQRRHHRCRLQRWLSARCAEQRACRRNQWSFNDANSSALITLPGNDRFKYVVMPMRI